MSYISLVMHRKKPMTKFQCLPFSTSLLYLPSRYFQKSRFDPCALNSYSNLFSYWSYFFLFYFKFYTGGCLRNGGWVRWQIRCNKCGMHNCHFTINVLAFNYHHKITLLEYIFFYELKLEHAHADVLYFRCRNLLCVV